MHRDISPALPSESGHVFRGRLESPTHDCYAILHGWRGGHVQPLHLASILCTSYPSSRLIHEACCRPRAHLPVAGMRPKDGRRQGVGR